MRRIALCLYALVLILPAIGCKKEEPAAAPSTPSTTETPAEGEKPAEGG
jgi:hypothetical protein